MSMLESPNFAIYHNDVDHLKPKPSAVAPQRKDVGLAKQQSQKPSDGKTNGGGAADRTDDGRGSEASGPAAADEPAGDMRKEEDRFATFAAWKVPFMSPGELAANGFYYFGRGDEVRCAFCRVEIGFWEEGDVPAVDHERWAPQCPLLRRKPTGNVPLSRGRDECGLRAAPTPAARRLPDPPANSATVHTAAAGPAHPGYASESSRLRSFDEWPRSMKQRPEVLSEAGFYYTGQGDKTVCFYCGGGLKDWEEADDPWEQHAKWFAHCAYILLNKGANYVRRVKNGLSSAPACDGSSASTELEETSVPREAVEVAPPSQPSPDKKSPSKDDKNLCKICYAEERDVCFIPCGHVVACSKCALSSSTCPLCRRPFTSTVRLYYS